MFSSIQCAARWMDWQNGLTHWIIALGDQPQVRLETLLRLLRLASAHPDKVCQLARHGRPRHPVLLPAIDFQRLRDCKEESLKQFLQNLPCERVLQESDDPGLDFDLDLPSDYEKAVRCFLTQDNACASEELLK